MPLHMDDMFVNESRHSEGSDGKRGSNEEPSNQFSNTPDRQRLSEN